MSLLPSREKVAEGRMRGAVNEEGQHLLPEVRPSPARSPRAGLGRPLPAAGEVTAPQPHVPSPLAGEGGRRPDEGALG